MRLQDKVALVTGGAGDIGLAIGRLFTQEGARVLLVDRREDALHAAVQDLGEDRATFAVGDVTDATAIQTVVQRAIVHYGRLDILVANAGIEGTVAPLSAYPEDDFDRVIAVNVRGTFLSLKYAMAAMRGTGGSIVVVSSVDGVAGSAGMGAYVASKHAAVGLMRTAALEGAAHGIRVNSVNPGPIEGRLMHTVEANRAPDDPTSARVRMATSSPMNRYGTPDEVAALTLFLASDESGYCTGGVYMVDGGRTAG